MTTQNTEARRHRIKNGGSQATPTWLPRAHSTFSVPPRLRVECLFLWELMTSTVAQRMQCATREVKNVARPTASGSQLKRSKLASKPERCRRKFLRFFPGGFADETYFDWERGYKEAAHDVWQSKLEIGRAHV